MISRVAESCTWMQRYMERASTTARLLATTTSVHLDAQPGHHWSALLIVSGELPRFVEQHGEKASEHQDTVVEYLTWDESCPVSIASSLRAARENARTSRDVISREVWEAINEAWLWFESRKAVQLFRRDAGGFFTRVRDAGYRFRGAALDTMMRDEPLRFMELGLLLERADQTARALDVKHHALGPTAPDAPESSADSLAWLNTLLSCSAYEGFFKKHRGSVRGPRVAEFLLLDQTFPRSVRACVKEAMTTLKAIEHPHARSAPSRALELLQELDQSTLALPIEALMDSGVHQHLTHTIDTLALVTSSLHQDFFDPRPPGPSGGQQQRSE